MADHGINVSRADTAVATPNAATCGIPFVIGTAPLSKATGTAATAGTPVLCTSYTEAEEQLGYDNDWAKFTVCEVMYYHFKLCACQPVIFLPLAENAEAAAVAAAVEQVEASRKRSNPMKYGRSLQELAIELDRQAKVKKDYVATAGAMQMTAVNENFDLVIGNTPFQLNENAHRQLGLQLKIPAPYYERMRAENPGLLMANVNGWFQQSPDTRRMVRTLDGTARAILSDRYRRIDNYEVAQTVLPIISEMQGARIESCELTDTRMYIKVVNERIQTEVVPGDIVQAGILISNSEVGMGSVSVKPLIYRLVCTNGMVADVGVGKRHVGRINESVDGDFGIFRDETIEADDRAFLMKIEDTVRAAVDEARFNALVQKLRDAKEAPILPAAAPKVVELAAKEFNIRQNESEGILGHLIAGGDLSLYGLANAVTRHAQDVQSYDRSTELEATGYKIITMQPALLKRWNEEVIF